MSAPSFTSFVPSFKSFKPDFNSAEDSGTLEKDGSNKAILRKSRQRRHRKSHTSSKHERHASDGETSTPPDRKKPDISDSESVEEHDIASSKFTQDQSMHSNELHDPWDVDTKGDKLNVQFGGLHSRSISRYQSYGRGRVLGLQRDLRIRRGDQRALQVAKGHFDPPPPISSSRFKAAIPTSKHHVLPTLSHSSDITRALDFVPLRERKHSSSHPPTTFVQDQDYFSDTSTTSSKSLADASLTLTADQLRLKEIELRISRDSAVEQDWITLLEVSTRSIAPSTKNSEKAIAEIAVSILERALKVTRSNRSSLNIMSLYLSYGEVVWSNTTLESKWEEALLEVKCEAIWLNWLDWRLRDSRNGGGFDGITENISRCISAVQTDGIKLLVFWRAVIIMDESGFSERSTALMQAQCELTLRKPAALANRPWAEQIDILEDFWDSETPRMGEPSARGWANWLHSTSLSGQETAGPKTSTVSSSATASVNHSDPYRRWMLEEKIGERQMPSRMTDSDLEENDPYGTVLFADIKAFLVDIRHEKGKLALKRIILSILGLCVPGLSRHLLRGFDESDKSIEEYWSRKQFRKNFFFDELFPPQQAKQSKASSESHAGVVLGLELKRGSPFSPIRDWAYGSLSPLGTLQPGDHSRMWEQRDIATVDIPVVRAVFEQLEDSTDHDWIYLRFAFEAAVDIKLALRFSQSQLEIHRNSVHLWIFHAELEALRGKRSASRKIYETLLNSDPTQFKGIVASTVSLWCSYAYSEWLDSGSGGCLNVLCRFAGIDKEFHTSLDVLKAKRFYQDQMSAAGDSMPMLRILLRMKALLDLITTSLDAGMSVFDHFLENSSSGMSASAEECIITDSLLLLYHHTSTLKALHSQSLVRHRVINAVARFPNNTFFLGLFLEIEKGQGVWGRVRSLIGEGQAVKAEDAKSTRVAPGSKSLTRHMWEVWAISQWLCGGRFEEEKYRIRQLFATSQQVTFLRGSSAFWRTYLEFEIRIGDLSRAKDILILATSHCPLSKDLYLLAFGSLRSEFSSRELNGWMDLMLERGVRIRKELGPYLESWEEDHMEVEDNDFHDDEELRADEYRRLLPY